MLSKLRYFATADAAKGSKHVSDAQIAEISNYFGDRLTHIEAVQGGTSSYCCSACIDGMARFLKTGKLVSAYQDVAKEQHLLEFLYGQAAGAEILSLGRDDHPRSWLVMNAFEPRRQTVQPDHIADVLRGLGARLRHFKAPSEIFIQDNSASLLSAGEDALHYLWEQNHLSDQMTAEIRPYFALLRQKNATDFESVLCHGDFSPANLVGNGPALTVIDWEDAFWGIEGYDFLYWMTFFENRKYLSQDIFSVTPWDKPTDIAILLLIIVVKCHISLLSKDYMTYSLTFEQRLNEILSLA